MLLLRKRRAFSLVELLVVIAIIGIVVALLMVAVQKSRQAAQQASCVNHLRQLGIAFTSYQTARGGFPTEGTASSPSLYRSLLPYVEQATAGDATPVGCFLCPGRRDTAAGAKRDYGYAGSQANGSVGGSILDANHNVTLAEICDGNRLDNTFLLTHVWMAPATYQGGDPTDRGWAQKLNGRSDSSVTRNDSDRLGNTNMLGGPHATLPTLFADGHVGNLSRVSPQQWAYANTQSTIEVTMTVTGGLILNKTADPYLQIQANGSLIVTDRVTGVQKQSQLTAQQMQQLQTIIQQNDFFNINAGDIAKGIQAAQQSGAGIAIGDGVTATIYVNLNGQEHTVGYYAADTWQGLYPGIKPLSQFVAVEQYLYSLAQSAK
jgi:prepilin-type N-terminal cleavage/methylation domain-containing protein